MNVTGYGTFTEIIDLLAKQKVDDNFISVLIMSIFCGLIIACICKAKKWKDNVLYILVLIVTFVVCGFDHVVANSFYLVYSGELFSVSGMIYFFTTLLGNFIGGYLFMLVPLLGVDEPIDYIHQDEEKKEVI